eukprot:TRINITY_DN14359_c0_g1_i5.p1 TRINITY_DN14359_c0_g1~~TRINITY_DN14359_c0_g1_i5.p1  ORF type:complete len:366 (+),score=75.03 TRINITY_DN14359_c0_g1_i5:428-1525(+)
MVLSLVLMSTCPLLLTQPGVRFEGYCMLRVVFEGCMAMLAVCAEAMSVERSIALSPEQSNRLQSLQWGSLQLLMTAGNVLGGLVLGVQWLGYGAVFECTSAVTVCIAVLVACHAHLGVKTGEDGNPLPALSAYLSQMKRVAGDWRYGSMATYMLLVSSMPGTQTSMFYYYTQHMGLSEYEMAAYLTWQQISAILGVGLYGVAGASLTVRKVMALLLVSIAACRCFHLVLLTGRGEVWGIPDAVFLLVDASVNAASTNVLQVPMMSCAALLCEPGLESVMFAVYTSAMILGMAVSSQLEAVLVEWLGLVRHDFKHIVSLRITSAILGLLPLLFHRLLPTQEALARMKEERMGRVFTNSPTASCPGV